MASRAVIPLQPREGGAKQKIGQAEGRNRKVLRDIGNLVAAPAVEGKPQTQITRPITRSFCAQLLANAQAAGPKNEKPLLQDGKAVVPAVKIAARKKESEKPKPEEVIIISPDDELKSKDKNQNTHKESRVGSSTKKPNKTFTSILTARSKAACGLTHKPKDAAVNIDAADAEDELAVVEYVEDIYNFYKLAEDDSRIEDYMGLQPDLNTKMRCILVDWLIEVHRKFELMPETLYLTINIVDRYLSMKTVPRRELQLVGISSMLIACKYEEIWAPEVNDFIAISDHAYVREQVLLMEKAILGKLEWYLTVPTPYVFLVRFIKASFPSDREMESMVFFLAELGLMHYTTCITYCPSMLAASAVYAALCTLNKKQLLPLWTETLKHHSGYSEDQLMECAKMLVVFHSEAAESKFRAVHRKFTSPDKGAVALFPPAKCLLPISPVLL